MSEQLEQMDDDDAFAQAFGQAVAAVDAAQITETKDESAVSAKNAEAKPKDGAEGKAGDEGSSAEAGGSEAEAKGAGGDGKDDGGESSEDGAGGSEAASGVKPAATADDIASLRDDIKALAKPAAKEEKEPEKESEKKVEEPKAYEYSPEEKALLENYSKEWDEHSKVFEVREKKLVHDLTQQLSHRFTVALDSVLQQIEQGLAPLAQSYVQSAQEKHVSAIQAAHPDFNNVKNELPAWIEKQPKYLQQTLKNTYDEGATEDVIELFSMFKKDTGRAQPQSQSPTPGKTPAPKKDPVPAEKVASMAPVTSKRTVIEPAGVDTSDYDSAFAEALASLR